MYGDYFTMTFLYKVKMLPQVPSEIWHELGFFFSFKLVVFFLFI